MNKVDLLFERHSVRRYTGEAVAPQDVKTILEAGMSAPSARNSQPWEFLVIQDRNKLVQCAAIRPYWKMLEEAPLAILVLADLKDYSASSPDFFIQDCSAASQNILLAATALGYGGVWLGIHPLAEPQERLRALLGIPEEVIPVMLLPIGRPLEPPEVQRRTRPEKVHYDVY
jgi:nitroreductase